MPLRRWIRSANFAIEGILHAARTQRHLRYHLYSAVIVLLLSVLLDLSREEFIAIAIVVMIVLATELVNTALEAAIDLFCLDFHPKAKAAKDIAAGAVLVTALGALVVGYMILYPAARRVLAEGLRHTPHSAPDIAMVALLIVLILVVLTKSLIGRGHPLRGGLPSGHAAVAFSVWVSTLFLTRSVEAGILVALLAFSIAASRVLSRVHTLWEVVLGALLGILVTFLLFFLFA